MTAFIGQPVSRVDGRRKVTGGATYALVVSTTDGEWKGSATVREADGDVAFGAWASDDPPSWTVAALRALLRSAWQRRRTGEPWPRRLARWRPTPAPGAESA